MVKTIKIILLSIITAALVGFMIALMLGKVHFSKNDAKLLLSDTFDATNIKSIKINTRSKDINIYESDTDKLKLDIYGVEKTNPTVKLENETLNITEKRKNRDFCIGFCFVNSRIDVYVPKSYIGEFDIEVTSGDINSVINSYNNYKINATSGDIKINKAASIEGTATSGDLEIDLINSYIGFKCTSGDIEIGDLTLNRDSYIESTSGDIEIDNVTNAYIDAKVTSGEVKIGTNDRFAEHLINIRATSGDIKAN